VVWPADPGNSAGIAAPLPPAGVGAVAERLLPTVLWATALYGVYTYLGVWLTGAGLTSALVARAISFYGIGALVGTLAGGQLADRFGSRRTMLTSLAGLGLCLFAFALGVGTGWAADVLLLVTSIFAQFFFPAQQAALARQYPQRRAFILALNNSALFLGISTGSVIGGEAMAWGGFGVDAAFGAAIACAGLVLVAVKVRP